MRSLKRINAKVVAFFIILAVFGFMAVGIIVVALVQNVQNQAKYEFNTFSSCSALAERLNADQDYYYPRYGVLEMEDSAQVMPNESAGSSSIAKDAGEGGDYSSTNIQVAGVDEADVIKTDGEYVYVIADKTIFIVKASNPTISKTLGRIDLTERPQTIFVNKDRLVVFTSSYHNWGYPIWNVDVPEYWNSSRSEVGVFTYDISDHENPELVRTIKFDGSYQTARMIGDKVYVVGSYYPNYYGQVSATDAELLLPQIADIQGNKSTKSGDYQPMAGCMETSYYGKTGRNFATVVAFDLNDPSARSQKVLVGGSESVYMSRNNLYLNISVYDYGDYEPPVCDWLSQILGLCTETSVIPPSVPVLITTQIFKLSVDGLDVKFAAGGEVPGTLLNQFSMDEHSGYFRVATTSNNSELGRFGDSQNNLYVLDDNMQRVGGIEGLAEGESIYSVRFLGDRAYLVTFKQMDPLFVIDLSIPQSPVVLGELKIPGFSDYLHPYDQDHIIGFGKDAELTGMTRGLKLALFDVSDPTEPKEIDKVVLGGRGSESELLYDHKALLFDREKELLVMPTTLYKSTSSRSWSRELSFGGFIVFNINLKKGFEEKGRISVLEEDQEYYYGSSQRSLYVGNRLFNWGNGKLIVSKLSDLSKIKELALGSGYEVFYDEVGVMEEAPVDGDGE